MASIELHLDESAGRDDFDGKVILAANGVFALGIATLAKWFGLKPDEIPLITQVTQNPVGAATSPTVTIRIDPQAPSGAGGVNDLDNVARDIYRIEATQGVGRSVALNPPMAVSQSLVLTVDDETRITIQYMKIKSDARWNDMLHLMRFIKKVDNEVESVAGTQFFQAGQINHVSQEPAP